MSLAGSSVSRTADSGIRRGNGIWTMIPATSGSALRRSISARSAPADARPGTSTMRPSMPTFSHERRIWLRYTADGASRPTMTTASAGAWPRRPRIASTSRATPPDLGRDGRSQQEPRLAGRHGCVRRG
jgi:hypothetical protein